ncbi:MAG: family 78 glycoside hydrolase catalytic domain [Microbacterium sp.]
MTQSDAVHREQRQDTPGDPRRGLLIDGSTDPVLAASASPLVSWPGLDASELSLFDEERGELWRAVTEPGVRELRIPAVLAPFARYRLRLRTAEGREHESVFETGPLTVTDWVDSWHRAPTGSAIVTRFALGARPDRARIYATAQGLFRIQVNGVQVGEGRLDPSRTARRRALYRAFEVTELLRAGENEVRITPGLGSWGATGEEARLLAELDHWTAGRRGAVPLSGGALYPSPVTSQVPFYLERYEPGIPQDLPLGGSAVAVGEGEGLPLVIEPDPTPPVRVVREFTPTERARPLGVRVYDLGENIAGRCRITLLSPLPEPTTITLVHGEHLDGTGRVDTTNLTMPYDQGRERQVFQWQATGRPAESAEPSFAYYGFRYVEVRGLPATAEIELVACVLHSDVADTLQVDTDDAVFARLATAARRTALNNLHGVPEDCPTREQAAWTGDMASAAEWDLAALDMRSLLSKWIVDLGDSQGADGAISGIAPDPRGIVMPPDPVWGSALHRVLWGHWRHYGDAAVVEAALPSLRAWAGYILDRIGESGIVDGFAASYGHDWLALEQTPPELLHTAAAIDTLEVLHRLEGEVAGRRGDEPDARVETLRRNAARRFVSEDGLVANGSQGAHAAALATGIVEPRLVGAVRAHLVADIRGRGGRVSTGFAATRWLVEVLTEAGEHELIAAVLRQPAEPGVGAMLASGPGTLWENWWIDPANTGTGSLDHVGLGAPFAAWLVRAAAGLSPAAAGWRRARFAPHAISGTDRIRVTLVTPRGEIEGGWHRSGREIVAELVCPPEVEVEVDLGEGGLRLLVTGGSHRWRFSAPEPRSAPPARAGREWRPPSIAPRAADIDREPFALSEVGSASGEVSLTLSPLNCMPIPHAQFGHEVLRASASEPPELRVQLRGDPRREGARFAYAYLDLCAEPPAEECVSVIRAHFDDGSVREARGRLWPAGWNRVAVELGMETDRLVAISAGVVRAGGRSADTISPRGAAGGFVIHLGEIGLSGRELRW